MHISAPFIRRPVATTLLTLGLALAGTIAFFLLPVAPLPNVDIPYISVSAQLPGASPQTVATSVTTPLERHLGAIAGVTDMTSESSVGSAHIVLEFELGRDIDGAARDVEAAIQAARADLPSALRNNPSYNKFNPADAPVMILTLTSDTLTTGQIYDSASTILEQRLLQIPGVGEVDIGGSSLPAVRVELNPRALFDYGIGLEDVRAALSAANANSPKGALEDPQQHFQLYVNDTAHDANAYRPLIIAYRKNAAVRLGDVATVTDGVENVRNLGLFDGKPSVLAIIHKQPGANVIDVSDRVAAVLPQLQASIPQSIVITRTHDRTGTIRASLHDVEVALLIASALVVLVVYLALRNARAALIPSVAVPLALIGTFGAMYVLGFSLDNLSLMALTCATGFVVDDAIVMLENIQRHLEAGLSPFQAAMRGSREVGFTVLAMTLSLIAVFLPILLMGGLVGRVFREFAMTLSVAILLSLLISVTTTPMMCAHVLGRFHAQQGRFLTVMERGFDAMRDFYVRTLRVALDHPRTVLLVLAATVVLNVYLYVQIPKGFFPQQDTGAVQGFLHADQDISFQMMEKKLRTAVDIVGRDPAVLHVSGSTGGGGGFGGGANTARLFIDLKPLAQRRINSEQVIARLRKALARSLTGGQLFLQVMQDLRAGGRQSSSEYEYTILADDLDQLSTWAPKITQALKQLPGLEDVNSDREVNGLDVKLNVDRATAAKLGINLTNIDNTLYDAFGQRQVSTIYNDMNQYHVVMEVEPSFWQSPDTLKQVWVSTSGGALSGTQSSAAAVGAFAIGSSNTGAAARAPGNLATASGTTAAVSSAARNQQLNALTNSGRGAASTGASVSTSAETMVPLAAVAGYAPGLTPMSISHQGPFIATTISFSLPVGESLGAATTAIQRTVEALHPPIGVHGTLAGTAQVFQQTQSNQLYLILAAIAAVYVVLGILYESYMHPITILSTLPSGGVGALLALLLFNTEFSLIALIGVVLLIGIVKKNAIIMIDVAITTERERQVDARTAIYDACLLRFRPIMMTTFAALFGALPLALTTGNGAELRQPLGISIVGGLLLSQILTLYTTPVVYMYLDRFRLWMRSLTAHRRSFLMGPSQQSPT